MGASYGTSGAAHTMKHPGSQGQAHAYFKPSVPTAYANRVQATRQASNGVPRAKEVVRKNNMMEYMPADDAAREAFLMRNARTGQEQRHWRKKYQF